MGLFACGVFVCPVLCWADYMFGLFRAGGIVMGPSFVGRFCNGVVMA